MTWWTDLAGIASALAAVGAGVAAALTARTSRRMWELELGREHERSRERARWQAALVGAWCTTERVVTGDIATVGLHLQNHSEAPIYDVVLTSTDNLGRACRECRLAVVPPGDYYITPLPTGSWGFPVLAAEAGALRPIMNTDKWAVTELRFRDADGSGWSIDKQGRLTRLETAA